MNVLIINGPNLNLLGKREPEIYGSENFETYFEKLKVLFPNYKLACFQSNHEGELIDAIQGAEAYDLIVMNPGGLSHTSISLADAISAVSTPVIEVHISNVHNREAFRQTLITATASKAVITGFGLDGYRMAIEGFFKGN